MQKNRGYETKYEMCIIDKYKTHKKNVRYKINCPRKLKGALHVNMFVICVIVYRYRDAVFATTASHKSQNNPFVH